MFGHINNVPGKLEETLSFPSQIPCESKRNVKKKLKKLNKTDKIYWLSVKDVLKYLTYHTDDSLF